MHCHSQRLCQPGWKRDPQPLQARPWPQPGCELRKDASSPSSNARRSAPTSNPVVISYVSYVVVAIAIGDSICYQGCISSYSSHPCGDRQANSFSSRTLSHVAGGNALTRYDRLLRIADRLAKVEAGGALADETIHAAVGLAGPVLRYTTDKAAAQTLLPPGFEWMAITPASQWVYAPCRRTGISPDGFAYPHHGQWGRTTPLSMCGGALRAWAMLTRQGNAR